MTDSHVGNWNRGFLKRKTLCQPMDSVRSCVDLNEGNVILALRPTIIHPFHRISVLLKGICNSLSNLWIFVIIFIKSVPLSNRISLMKDLSGRFGGYFENLSRYFMFNLRLTINYKNWILAYLCLSVSLFVRPSIIVSNRNKLFANEGFNRA